MEDYQIWNALLYAILFIAACILIIKLLAPNKKVTPKKTISTYVHISSDEKIDFSKDTYDLEWKPERKRDIEPTDEIVKTLKEIENISPLVTNLVGRLNKPDSTPKEIAQLIATDQSLTAYILKRANSAYYGLVQKIDNIFNAIVVLGYNEIHRIVIEERLRKVGIQPLKAEWTHANITSNIAAYLANMSNIGVHGGTAVTMGILHDIARNVMIQSSSQPQEDLPQDPRQRLRREIEIYGVDHATLGALLARRWNMPGNLCTCIEIHHHPMFWPLRDVGQYAPNAIKNVAVLAIADVAARHFMGEINGPYIGEDYYMFIKRSPQMDRILTPTLTRELEKIKALDIEQKES